MKRTPACVLVLRTCAADLTSYQGFQWPKKGTVKCKDWSREPVCGRGLHGLLWGEGDGSLLDWTADARWLVVRVRAADIVDIGGKVKYPSGTVVYCGDRKSATEHILKHGAAGKAVVGSHVTAGDGGTATAGDGGTATAGVRGTATAGVRGTATAGDGGTATAGDGGTATAGVRGTATAGDGGTATAGESGVIILRYWDGRNWKIITGTVGEDGIEPNIAYIVDSNGKFVKKERQQ